MRRFPFIIAGALLLPSTAFAQVATNNGVDQLLQKFHTASAAWTGPLETLALGSFGILAVIDLVYFVGIRQIMSGNWDLSSFMWALVNETLHIAFFFWLLTAFATTGPLIITGFQYAAHQAGGLPMSPNDIFNTGWNIANQIGQQASIWHPGDAVVTILCGLIVQGCFVAIVASMVYVIVESYFVVTAGQILGLFGALRFTSDIPISLIRTCIGIGLKLFALQLIASVGTGFIRDWIAQITTADLDGILLEIGQTVLLAAISISVPHMFERMVSPVGTGGVGNVVGSAATIAAAGTMMGRAAAAAITRAAGWGASAVSAGRLAGAQMGAANDQGRAPTSAAKRAATLIGSTGRNMVAAKAEDISRGLSGQRTQAGSAPWRQAANMSEQRRLIEEERDRPQPQQPSNGGTP
jgi:type IV secretion system protein TrbL